MRVTTETGTVSYTYTEHNTSRCGTNYTRSRSRDITTLLLSRSDVRKNKRDQNGFRAPSPYSFAVQELTPAGGSNYSRRTNQSPTCGGSGASSYRNATEWEGFWWTPQELWQFPMSTFNLKPRQQIINSAFAKLKNQKINLGMSLAFVGQTSGMIRDGAVRLREAYRLIRLYRWRDAARVLRISSRSELSKLYLEVLFGWMQLARDIEGLAEVLSEESRKKETFVYGRSRSSATQQIYNRREWPLPNQNFSTNLPPFCYRDGTRRSENRCVVIGTVTTEGLHNYSRLGLINPAEIAWDVLRWSWVIDQFVHIGGFLNAYDATAGLTYKGGSYTEFTEYVVQYGFENRPSSIYSAFVSDSPGLFVTRQGNRTLVDDNDISITVRNPFQANVAVAAAAVLALTNTLRGGGPVPRHYRV